MSAQSVRERPFAVLVVAMAVNVGALLGLFTAAPVFEASASVVITAKTAGATTGATPESAPTPGTATAADLDQAASRAITALRGSNAAASPDGVELTLADRSMDGSHVIVVTATADSRTAAQTATRTVAESARTQIASGGSDVAAELVRNPAVVAGHTVSAARILLFSGAAGLVALLLVALASPARRRPTETVIAAPRTHEPPTRSGAGLLHLAPAVDEEEADDDIEHVAAPTRPPADRPRRQSARERQAAIKQMVQVDWARSGSNVAWTRKQTKAAFERAERQLEARERADRRGGPSALPADSTPPADDWQSWGLGG